MKKYWDLINSIQAEKSPENIRTKCNEIERIIRNDNSISNDDFDEMMMTITFLYRESYHF